jgi:DNA ligase-1
MLNFDYQRFELIMLNSDQIFDIIEEIAKTSSTKAKEEKVKAHISDAGFIRVLEAAYNPLKSYGIAIRPETIGENCDHQFDERTWELIKSLETRKLTGSAAIEAVRGELTTLDKKSSELLWRILSKDLRAGFGETIINKAVKGLIPEFPYMRCSLPKNVKLNEWDWETGVISQEKVDGMFVNVDFEDDEVTVVFRSRQGNPFPESEAINRLADQVRLNFVQGTQTHGELLVVYSDPALRFCDSADNVIMSSSHVLSREAGNGMLNSLLGGGELEDGYSLRLMAWDQIPLTAVTSGKFSGTYGDRCWLLWQQVSRCSPDAVSIIDSRVVHSLKDAYAHFSELLAMGKEGTIIKKHVAVWRDGTSKEQVKLKLEFEVELEVVGFELGCGKHAETFGSLICESDCGKLKVSVSGFKDALRQEIHLNRDDWLGSVVTVRANEIMKPGQSSDLYSLFLPRFVERRYDKSVADDLDRIVDQKESAIAAV